MRRDSTPTDRSDNFERRLRQTMDSELQPEQVTPNTAGAEELDYNEKFPLVDDLKQSNMHPRFRGFRSTQKQAGKDND